MKRALLLAAAMLAFAGAAQAQQFPNRPVTLVVPWPAGGGTDIGMRALATATEKHLGQKIVIENKPGASGTIGPANMAATAAPDGYTVAQIPITVFRLPAIQKTNYDPAKDFTYIIQVTGYTFGVVVRARCAVEDVQRIARLRQGQSQQDQLRRAGRGHEPAHHHGADRQAEGHQVDHGAVQGSGGQPDRAARRTHRCGIELDRLGRHRERRQGAAAGNVGRDSEPRTGRTRRRSRTSASTWCRTRRSASPGRRGWTRRW